MGGEGEASVGTGGDEQVNVNIRCTNSSKYSVKTDLQSTVGEFKALLAQHCDVPAEQQRLIYKGRILKDDQTLISYGILFPIDCLFFYGVSKPPPEWNMCFILKIVEGCVSGNSNCLSETSTFGCINALCALLSSFCLMV
ncbi:ubiquitin domain-containing protein dsk2b [Phtheirospermum japonicum]|uniref:Ubiquitin domain-containing protein dsk2b n=1 Tax=Phtheirospermum japonicum TaxID=374723 RepID=A0A830B9C5_9LAMI|nr:ubiquitin domain-containing protein dsk2b [Phtheirospermum japonicum]